VGCTGYDIGALGCTGYLHWIAQMMCTGLHTLSTCTGLQRQLDLTKTSIPFHADVTVFIVYFEGRGFPLLFFSLSFKSSALLCLYILMIHSVVKKKLFFIFYNTWTTPSGTKVTRVEKKCCLKWLLYSACNTQGQRMHFTSTYLCTLKVT
jgi:hypothetical protein